MEKTSEEPPDDKPASLPEDAGTPEDGALPEDAGTPEDGEALDEAIDPTPDEDDPEEEPKFDPLLEFAEDAAAEDDPALAPEENDVPLELDGGPPSNPEAGCPSPELELKG